MKNPIRKFINDVKTDVAAAQEARKRTYNTYVSAYDDNRFVRVEAGTSEDTHYANSNEWSFVESEHSTRA